MHTDEPTKQCGAYTLEGKGADVFGNDLSSSLSSLKEKEELIFNNSGQFSIQLIRISCRHANS
jgi:hypothetical protein